MKPVQLNVGVTYKKSLPNYENITFHAGITMAIEEGESHEEVYKKAWDIAGEEIAKQLALFEKENKSGMKKGL